MRVTTADFIKHYGSLADQALTEPLTITKNGRDRLVLVSAEEFSRLKSRDRRAVFPEDLSNTELELIAKAEVPVEYAALDAEMKGYVL
ncbi:prevent-host-death family protein [Acidithiobacillus sp. GGI-221]|nr:prevent-host-death family protein [Acidithiobacillus sp. GGI-221]